jgi:PAS domain-containing protein
MPAGAGQPDRDTAAARLRFDLAIDAAGIGSFAWDLTSGPLEWDDRLLEMFGVRGGQRSRGTAPGRGVDR